MQPSSGPCCRERSMAAPEAQDSRLMNIWLKLLLIVPIAVVAIELAIAVVTLVAAISHGTLTGPVRRVVVRESSAR